MKITRESKPRFRLIALMLSSSFSIFLHGSILLNFQGLKDNSNFLLASRAQKINVKIIYLDKENSFIERKLRKSSTGNLGQSVKKSGKVTSAKLKGELEIKYPKISRLLKEEGKVILEVSINSDGSVNDLTILKSSGFFRLDHYAQKKVLAASFIPKYKNLNGKIVSLKDVIKLEVIFKLNNN